ncbi:MAG: aminotransferase class III-fold pyridoxal phosphate-dependent enzyme, partial [Oscillospiraceae bacterium]|nr:aminotransferase class III-fold pyridoxal phosphate-dependent enzyme [Oscillospiraceae bacterium]
MTFEELRELDRQYVVQSYGRNPIAIHHGQGATLYGLDGREYIDFASGIGVLSVGTAHPKWTAAVAEQAGRLGHISNLYYSEPYARLAEKLCIRSGMAAAFFGNSGAEGNEGIIKLARKWSWEKYGEGRGTIITLNRSFHGRTITTLAATGQDVFHKYFFPFTEGFRRAEPSLDSVKQAAGHDVCAVLVELVQGEGGVLPLDPDF